jgi:ABC-type amino acid transport substrate-binding protein
MTKSRLCLKFILPILVALLMAVQCQGSSPQATDQATNLSSNETSNQHLNQPTNQPTVLLFPPIQPGDGSDLMDRLLEKGVLRVGIRVWPEAVFAPPAFRGISNAATGGTLNGFEVDVARLLAEGLGLELELVEAYPPVILSGDWRGEWDIALASLVPFDQPPEQTVTSIAYSNPYGYFPMGILVPAENNSIQTVSDLSGRRIGVLEYSAYQRLLSSQDPPLTFRGQPLLLEIPDDVQPVALSNLLKAIRQLGQPAEDKEADVEAIFGPVPILEEAIKSDMPVKLAPQAQNLGYQPLAVATVPQDGLKVDRLMAEINTVLDYLQQKGYLAEIYFRWYRQDYSQWPPNSGQDSSNAQH